MIGGRPSDEKLNELGKKNGTIICSITGPFAYVNAASHIARFEEMHDDCRNVIRHGRRRSLRRDRIIRTVRHERAFT